MLILTVLLLLSASPAMAGEPEAIARQAAGCWDLPAGTAHLTKASFDVEFDADGYLADATVLDHKAGAPGAEVFVWSAIRAFQKCGPYDVKNETVRVIMQTSDIRRGIDPFKD